MAREKMICTIERNGETKLKQKLPTPASRDNGIRMNVLVERKIGEVFHCLGFWEFWRGAGNRNNNDTDYWYRNWFPI